MSELMCSQSKCRRKDEHIVELKAELAALRESEKFYHIRCDELQIIQSRMRDPERQIVCDILANGKPRDKAGIGDYALPQESNNAQT